MTPWDDTRESDKDEERRWMEWIVLSMRTGLLYPFYVLKGSSAQGRNPWRPTSAVGVFTARRPSSR